MPTSLTHLPSNKYYETFKGLHLIMAALFFTFLFIHCDFILTSWDYLIAAAVIYSVCLLSSQLRTWFEYGITTSATLELTTSGAIRVSIPTTSSWWPGQHIFIRFLTLDLHTLTSHPFTICSLPIPNRSPSPSTEDPMRSPLTMNFYISPRSGLTARLSSLTQQSPGGKNVRVLLDGPYGGLKHRTLQSFNKALLIAGGAGAGFTLPVIEDFLQREYPGGRRCQVTEGEKSYQTKTLRVVLAVKTEAYRAWYEEMLKELIRNCGLEHKTDALVVHIYVTEPGTPSGATQLDFKFSPTSSPSTPSNSEDKEKGDSISIAAPPQGASDRDACASIHRGPRPDLPALIKRVNAEKAEMESLGIAVCGPSGMLFDVRNAAASAQVDILKRGGGEVWLYQEHFGW